MAVFLCALITATPELTLAGEGVVLDVAPDAAPVFVAGEAAGGAWRCLLELAPGTRDAGVWFQAAPDRAHGWLATLGAGLRLLDASGSVLWEDPYCPWRYYTPYLLELVVEPGSVRLQLLAWDRVSLLSQSEPIPVPAAPPGTIGFQPGTRPVRFFGWEHAATPLAPLVPDAPNKLRLRAGEGTDWRVVGDGEWRWTTPEQAALRQVAAAERGTAIARHLGGAEGTWRCRVKVDPGTGGAGLLFACADDAQSGFLCWLGGEWGNGGLMLYRLPLQALWTSPQGRWRYDTEYQLEATIAEGRVSVRQLAADGTEIAASPALELTEAERGRAGSVGYQVWRGTAAFWDFAGQAAPPEPVASPLGEGWLTAGGAWRRDGAALVQTGPEPATALARATSGSQGIWRCDVTAEPGTRAVGLVFQAADDLRTGWLARLGERLTLESLDGRLLWQSDAIRLEPGRAYRLEGLVVTDRVALRLRASDGTVLAESIQVYVTDTNNTRRGALGLRTEGGGAAFSNWALE